jgi:hypothetical protein
MGAGNRYTLEENNNVLAYQLDVSCDCFGDENYECDCKECQLDYLKEVLLELPIIAKYGLTDNRYQAYYGDSFIVDLKENYHGDAIVIDFLYQESNPDNLTIFNYERSYNKLIKHINKRFPLFVGLGYTRSNYEAGEIK